MSDIQEGPPEWGGPPPAQDFQNRLPQSGLPLVPPALPSGPWGVWATLGWMALMVLAMAFANILALFPYYLFSDPGKFSSSFLQNAASNGDYVWINFLVTIPILGLIMALALLLRQGYPAREYLAIKNTRAVSWVVWPVGLAAFSLGADFLMAYLGVDPMSDWMGDVYESARCFPCLMIAVILIAPVLEELIFRGFVFTGIQARLGSFWAVIFAAVPWTLIHIQYMAEWYFIALIFIIALLLGLARWRTGSLLVPIIMHMVQNTIASVEMYFFS